MDIERNKPQIKLTKPRFDPGEPKPPAELSGSPNEHFQTKGRLWISTADETFLGYGRIVLLERIKEWGSITKAAASMGMAYRHAWKLVDSMNRQSSAPLVSRTIGGKNGGGAKVTAEGQKIIDLFWKMQEKFRKNMEELQFDLKALNSEKPKGSDE